MEYTVQTDWHKQGEIGEWDSVDIFSQPSTALTRNFFDPRRQSESSALENRTLPPKNMEVKISE
ncbi:hypothetical protein BY996DRAFT_6596060 [Phakopsora pachyrhizi]|nr:hypothetical protein BY996DRAFT_6596060 [Phakopsora pachyrhizi]